MLWETELPGSDDDGTERQFAAALVRAAMHRGESPWAANRHIAALAKQGASTPASLTLDEIQDVCFAFVSLARRSEYLVRTLS